MSRELQGWARPRPLRIAFLVEDGEHGALVLDGVFADCYDRWGGRFSLLVPCVSGRIQESYWPWLEAYDPDIVYSYAALSKVDVLEIHERLSPSEYMFHELGREPRLDVFGFKPSYRFSPLPSLSNIFTLARHRPMTGEQGSIRIINSWHTERPSRFLTDNFGTYHYSRATGMYPPDAEVAAGLLTIVSPEFQADRKYGIPPDLTTIPSEIEAFKQFVSGRAISLSMASLLLAPKLNIDAGSWSESFNLVVGDSFSDRVLFWNARLLIPAWLDSDLCCFRVGMDHIRNPETLNIIGDLLKRRNHVNSGSGGQAQLTIRSSSLTSDEVAEAHKLILSTKPWSSVRTEMIPDLNAVVPSADGLEKAREGNRFGGGVFQPLDQSKFLWSAPTVRPEACVPDQLSDAPARQSFTEGYWCTDFVFENDGPRPRFSDTNYWELPRRWRMAGAFKTSFAGGKMNELPLQPRRSRYGNFGVFVSVDRPIESIEVPPVGEAMRYALAVDGGWPQRDVKVWETRPSNKVAWTRPSNEARYLTGVLGMTGGLERAQQFLLHPFLREQFAKLGGTPSVPKDQVVPTLNRLQKRSQRQAAFDLKSEDERNALAHLIIKAAQSIKSPLEFVRYESLKSDWQTYRAAFWARHSEQAGGDTTVDWDAHEKASLDDCLAEMRQRQMLYQGHQWTCPKCHHRNWVDFSALSSNLICSVCAQATQAPVDIGWLFRPNEFLIESLRERSVLSLVWALSALRERSRSSFLFDGPTWFGFSTDSDDPDAEADLLVLLDGRALLCEIKSSWRGLRLQHIEDFVALASRLRPDVALLAVMESGAGPVERLSAAQTQLASEGIGFELLTPDQYDPEGSPYLDFDSLE